MAKIHSDLQKASKGVYIGGCIIMVLAAIPFVFSFFADIYTPSSERMLNIAGICMGLFIAILGKLIELFVDMAMDIKTIAQNYEPEPKAEIQRES